MKLKATSSIKSLLIFSVVFLFFNVTQLLTSVMGQRPIWIIVFFIIPLPVFLVLVTITSLDLVKRDYVTLKGKLVEKQEYTVGILTENDKVKKFRVDKAYINDLRELKLNQEIEIEYYKRTKAVTCLKC